MRMIHFSVRPNYDYYFLPRLYRIYRANVNFFSSLFAPQPNNLCYIPTHICLPFAKLAVGCLRGAMQQAVASSNLTESNRRKTGDVRENRIFVTKSGRSRGDRSRSKKGGGSTRKDRW